MLLKGFFFKVVQKSGLCGRELRAISRSLSLIVINSVPKFKILHLVKLKAFHFADDIFNSPEMIVILSKEKNGEKGKNAWQQHFFFSPQGSKKAFHSAG